MPLWMTYLNYVLTLYLWWILLDHPVLSHFSNLNCLIKGFERINPGRRLEN